MDEKGSSRVAARKQPSREKTRFPGVYVRKITNKRTGKPDTAFDITYKSQDGKKVWVFVGYNSDGVNAAYASQRRGAMLDEISKGDKPNRDRRKGLTFAEGWTIFDTRWLPNLANPQDERNRYQYYLEPDFAGRRMDSISTMDLEAFKTKLLSRGLANATVRMVLSDIRRMYRKLAAWELYSGKIPTDGLVMPKLDNARTRFLTQDEAINLLEAVRKRSHTWHDIAFISLYTGMRKGEVLHLRGEHLDFNSSRILIKNSKTGSRSVPMTPEVRQLLLDLTPTTSTGLVFTRSRGDGLDLPISSDSDESFVRAVGDCDLNAGITDTRHKVVFHTLRHTYCSWLAMSGVPLFTIGELVGHTTTQMTKRYSHLCPDTTLSAASKIGELMKVARTKKHESTASEKPDTDQ